MILFFNNSLSSLFLVPLASSTRKSKRRLGMGFEMAVGGNEIIIKKEH